MSSEDEAGPFRCYDCDGIFEEKTELIDHLKVIHGWTQKECQTGTPVYEIKEICDHCWCTNRKDHCYRVAWVGYNEKSEIYAGNFFGSSANMLKTYDSQNNLERKKRQQGEKTKFPVEKASKEKEKPRKSRELLADIQNGLRNLNVDEVKYYKCDIVTGKGNEAPKGYDGSYPLITDNEAGREFLNTRHATTVRGVSLTNLLTGDFLYLVRFRRLDGETKQQAHRFVPSGIAWARYEKLIKAFCLANAENEN